MVNPRLVPLASVLLLILAGAAWAQEGADREYRLVKDIAYRSGDGLSEYAKDRCRLDLYCPADRPGFATVVWFHGGGLTNGSRSIPDGLKRQGIAVVAGGYRLGPHVKSPVYIEDAAAAVAWTFRNIASHGGATNRIFVSGHSAGGYLAAMVGLDKRWLRAEGIDADAIAGLIPLSPQAITHFTIRAERGIRATQPVLDDLAPLHHVRADAPPLLLITGDRERELLGRYEENAYFWRMMNVVGHKDTELRELAGFDHGRMAEPALPLVREFIARRTTSFAAASSPAAGAASGVVRVLVWDEQQPEQKRAYGDRFLGETIAAHLAAQPGLAVKSVSLASPNQGLDAATLDATDVVIWWSHVKNPFVTAENVERVVTRVREGRLGFVALHSAHWARPFVRLMQERAKDDARAQIPAAERATAKFEYFNENPLGKVPRRDAPLTPALRHEDGVWKLMLPGCIFPAYRGDGAPSHVTTLLLDHPIAAGLPRTWEVEQTEMYDEPFHVPAPDAVVFEERWDKGERFRSGCAWQVGRGRVFYFRPGHETYPVFRQAGPLRVVENAARWAAPRR